MKIPKLPQIFRDVSESLAGIFSFSRREFIIAAAGIAVLAAAAFIITAAVAVSKRPDVPVSAANVEKALSDQILPVAERPFLSDFIIYEDKIQESFTGAVYSREPLDRWSDEMVDEYWIDPKKIAIEHLEQDVEKTVMDIFADVP